MGETVTKLLGALFEFGRSAEDRNTQLGILLGLTSELLSRALNKFTTDKAALAKLVASLENLSKRLTDIGGWLRKLSDSLPDMMEADRVLSGVFDVVQRNLALVADREDSLTPEELTAVVAAWKQDGEHVKRLLNAMKGVAAAPPKPMVATTVWVPAYPITPAALRSHQLVNTGGRDK